MFNVKIHCVVFSTNINQNKRYILSLEDKNIVFPSFDLIEAQLVDLDKTIIDFVKGLVFVSDLELLPQIITLHSPTLSNNPQDINVIYGFIINHTESINNSHWVEFELLKEQQLSPVLFEVIQQLR